MKYTILTTCWQMYFIVFLFSCTNQSKKENKVNSAQIRPDTAYIVGTAAQYLFDIGHFPKEFADTNMMIIKSDTLPFNDSFKFCGKDAVFVKAGALTDSILLQVMNPKPFLELVDFNLLDGDYLIGLKFKTVGKKFDLILHEEQNKSYSIKEVIETEF